MGYVVVAMVILINSVIGGFTRVDLAVLIIRLQGFDYIQLSDHTVRLQFYRMISKN